MTSTPHLFRWHRTLSPNKKVSLLRFLNFIFFGFSSCKREAIPKPKPFLRSVSQLFFTSRDKTTACECLSPRSRRREKREKRGAEVTLDRRHTEVQQAEWGKTMRVKTSSLLTFCVSVFWRINGSVRSMKEGNSPEKTTSFCKFTLLVTVFIIK